MLPSAFSCHTEGHQPLGIVELVFEEKLKSQEPVRRAIQRKNWIRKL